ncbi:MAG: UDP-N-acetylmuramate dehydrogenase [Flavobacteriales bacterium]|nr:UDP-N-acetylmuramate dehydrogenase [Flavobacteriales bacterium]
MEILRDADLKPYNTFGIAARAEALARFRSLEQLRELLGAPELSGLQPLILGGGSNVLFTRNWDGVVLLNEVPGLKVLREDEAHIWLRCGAGVVWHDLVRHAVANGWGGLENLSLIPGRVGAAPMQNIGAYGVELKDTFDSLEALKIDDGTVVTFRKEQCHFGYRESYFKREGKDRFVILNVTFKLSKRPVLNTSYGNIGQVLEKTGITAPTLRDVSDAVIAIRSSKLPDPKVIGNAGSFFKNPVVPLAVADAIRTEYPDVAAYPAGEGYVKLAAGWLIEKAGWKGFREDGFGVHKDQALVLVNHGGATGRNIFDLSTRILASIHERFGVELEREVNII